MCSRFPRLTAISSRSTSFCFSERNTNRKAAERLRWWRNLSAAWSCYGYGMRGLLSHHAVTLPLQNLSLLHCLDTLHLLRAVVDDGDSLARLCRGWRDSPVGGILRAFLHGHGIGGFCYGHRTCGGLCSIGGRGGDDYPSSVAAHAPMAIIMATSVSIYRCFHNRYVRLKVTTVKR